MGGANKQYQREELPENVQLGMTRRANEGTEMVARYLCTQV
jgi:hypothetical protein